MTAHEARKMVTEISKYYITVGEASRLLGIREEIVRCYICKGKFGVFKVKSLTLVSKREVLEWKRTRRRRK